MSNTNNGKKSQQLKETASATSSKNVQLGDDVLEVAKTNTNERTQEIVSLLVNMLFDYIESKVKDLPKTVKKIRKNPETAKEVSTLWSRQLYENGLIPYGYNGLTDNLLIHNFHQDGYLDGMYVGYLLSMITLAENGVDKNTLLSARKDILLKFGKKSYESRETLCKELEKEMQKWTRNPVIDKSNIKEL